MSREQERDAFRAGWWAAWYSTSEGRNVRKTDKELNEEEYDAYATWRLENR